jgi:ketosteroid isomerase-like protein
MVSPTLFVSVAELIGWMLALGWAKTHLVVAEPWAAVELEALSTALNGEPFNNRYCWVTRFAGEQIVEVRAYLGSALVQQVLADNER